MANSYTTGLRLSKPALGDTGWGSTVNGGVTDLVDQAVSGAVSVAVTSATTTTLPTIADGASSDARNMSLLITGSLTTGQTATVRVPATGADVTKLYSIRNAAGEAVTVETSGGASVSVPHDRALLVRVTSTGVYEAVNYAGSLTLGTALAVASGGTGITSFGTGVATALGQNVTGSGGIVLASGPTLGAATFTGGAQTTPTAVVFSATAMTVDCSLSNVFTTTFTANVTNAPTFSNPRDGQTINWFITQDGTGGRTITWPASFKWPTGTATALSLPANSVDLVVATYINATGFWYASLSRRFI